MNISSIAKAHNVSRQAVYRALNSAHSKLYSVLKYAYMCGFGLLHIPENFDELIKATEKENYFEDNQN